MQGFDDALPLILRYEGGSADDPDDAAAAGLFPGEKVHTRRGITQATYDAYRTSRQLSRTPVRLIADAEIKAIYLERYWKAASCDALAWPVSLVHFDAWVQHRPDDAAKLLQRELGVVDDGLIGPKTRAAMGRIAEPVRFAENLLWRRLRFYVTITRARPQNQKFLAGWVVRMDQLRQAASA